MEYGGQRHVPAAPYPRERDPVPYVQEVGWVPGLVWTGAENLTPTGIRYLDSPARSESSLYRLIYSGPLTAWVESLNTRDHGREKTYRSCQKHYTVITAWL
jgi:hypothetical protein